MSRSWFRDSPSRRERAEVGVACEVEWEIDREDDAGLLVSLTRIPRPPRARPGGCVMPTRRTGRGEEGPLWPSGDDGARLRRAYLDDGEHALCSR